MCTQPLTVITASFGASPAKIPLTLNVLLFMVMIIMQPPVAYF